MANEAAKEVFNEYRTARLNRRYYERKLKAASRLSLWMDLVTLVSISTIGVGLWLVPTSTAVAVALKVFALIAAFSAVFQFLAKPAEKAAACEAYVASYEAREELLGILVRRVKSGGGSINLLNDLESILTASRSVKLRRVESEPNHALLEQLYEEVNREIPPTFFEGAVL